MLDNLTITIEGSAGVGKTRVAVLIRDFLHNHGFHIHEIHLKDSLASNLGDIRETLPLAIDEIKQKCDISIIEKQLPRKGSVL